MRLFLSRAIVVLVLLGAAAPGARGEAPLTTADLVRFLKAGISEKTILTELDNRGFSEPLSFERETSLREAGATETLVVAVRRTSPPEVVAAPVVPAPPRTARYEPGAPILAAPGAKGEKPTFSAAARTVRVPVSVLDKSGRPLMGLHGSDFKISEEGKPQEVTLFSGERQPLRIAMALDVSGSMKDKIRQVERSLRYFIDLLEPADQIMVITFNDRVRVVQDFTSDRDLLYRVLDMLEPVGGTALYDAAYEAILRVGKGPAETKAVVLVSDGVDTTSGSSFNALRDLARRSEVPVYSIGLNGSFIRNLSAPPRRPGGGGGFPGGPRGRGRPPGGGPGFPGPWPGGGGGRGGTPDDGSGGGSWPGSGGGHGGGRGFGRSGFDAGPLLDLAEETGGRAEILDGLEHYSPDDEAPGSARMQRAVESIALTLRHRYLIGYEPPAQGRRGWRKIDVEVDLPSATARAKKGYYAGS
jgi:VWFA-related protein